MLEAVRRAVFSPLLETDIEGATGIIVNIVGGDDMKLGEVNEACDIIKSVIDPSANIILGTAIVPDKQEIEITIIATGFVDRASAPARAIGSVSMTQPHSIATALNEQPLEKPEEKPVEKREEPARPQYTTEEIFASRPTFGRPQPAAPQQPIEQPVQPAREPQAQPAAPQQPSVKSSVIGGKSHQVPAFLRRLRGEDNN